MENSPPTEPLQFDTATVTAEAGRSGVVCALCHGVIQHQYFDVNGKPVCESCRGQLAAVAENPREWGTLARSAALGVVAAVAGAALYYGVIALANLEIGIVAIAIGYMVGYAVRFGARGRGGRRFQVLALVLTYWSVGLGYVPLAFRGAPEQTASDSASPAVPAPAPAPEVEPTGRDTEGPGVALSLLFLIGFSLALPVLVIIGSLPSGLISGAILAFGMLQAWRMTGTPSLQVSGPYRIGEAQSAAI